MHAGHPTERQRMGLWVRRGEKQLLREAQTWVRREMDGARIRAFDTAGMDDGPAVKRRRT